MSDQTKNQSSYNPILFRRNWDASTMCSSTKGSGSACYKTATHELTVNKTGAKHLYCGAHARHIDVSGMFSGYIRSGAATLARLS